MTRPKHSNGRRRLLQAAALAALPGCSLQAGRAGVPAPGPSDQKVVHGRIERLADFPSRHVDARHVEAWLPPGYDGRRPHAVL